MAQVTSQSLGHSHPVANVQAFAAAIDGHKDIPPRYIRPEAESDPIVRDGDCQLPVIDLKRLLDPEFSEEESAKLDRACEEWGFFQLINHGVPDEVIKRMKEDIMEFFKLPLEEKKAFAQLPNNLEGYGQAFVVSEDQKLDWADMVYLISRPLHSRNMRFWPTNPPTFRATLDNYSLELKQVAGCLFKFLAKNLGIEPGIISNIFKDQPQGVRINYYPPCPKADKVLGISSHTDATGLTLLLQVSDVQGLQIKKDGKWFPVDPLPGAFVVNIGDILEILSNGKYKSAEHRATINTEKERLSIAAFHGPDHDSMVGPLPELLKGGKEHYKTMSYGDYTKTLFSAKLDGRSLLESMKLND
ncbi:2-oxoglutarate-dependent dioxygenase 11-like [Elaeis guineensis]|uniref:2-oxoglutarate-dependent dioxygenase 11-like n=1 Tax=Elaeis guineensis var. tenera TaxID=51953 RepID=UPI003C6D99A1